MRILSIALCVLSVSTMGFGHTQFTSLDGSKTLWATPLSVDSHGHVRFVKQGGKMLTAKVDSFSEADQKGLRAWMEAMKERPQVALNARVAKAKPLRILFIGNSYSFKIPKAFELLAREHGKKVEVDQVTHGGWTLARHAESENTLKKITRGNWDVVVLQEQSVLPTFPEKTRKVQMYPAVNTLAAAAQKIDAIPVLFLTWGRKGAEREQGKPYPAPSYFSMQDALSEAYDRAAENAGGLFVVPVGKVWQEVRKTGKDNDLYAKDGSHPLNSGNFLGACAFYTALYGEKVTKPERRIEHGKLIATMAEVALLKPLRYPLQQE